MIIRAKITPNSKTPEITELENNRYRIRVDAPASGGKANARLIEILSDHFKISKSSIRIIDGHKSKNKLLEVLV